MSEYSAMQISKPCDEQTFERCNVILWRCILGDESVQLHGRRGQRQRGVDLIGLRDGQPEQIVGVQCKLKSEGQVLTEAEVRKEVEKALTFTPPLAEYFIVTTAPDDQKLQRLALELSLSVSDSRERPLKIRIWGWGDLEREIRRYPDAIRAFDPSHTPQGDRIIREVGSLAGSMEMVRQQVAVIHRSVTQGQAISPIMADTAIQSILERQVNSYSELVSSDPDTARRLLQQLQAELDDEVRADIRFRVAANVAACHFNLAKEEAAAREFIAAYAIDPGNPKAVAHKALGLFLLGDWTTLKAFAETQLSKQPDNALLAAHYVRGMIDDSTVTDPLAQLPAAVRSTAEVAEAHISWLMDRGSHGEWWHAAFAAYEAHPGSDALSEMYASALLERITARVGHLDRHILTEDERTDVDAAIGIYEVLWPKLRDDARRIREEPVSIPINLVLAYRLRHQVQEAMEIAYEALARFPGNAHVAKAAASVLMEQGEGAQAGALLSEIEIDRETVVMRFGLAMASEDWDAVSDLVGNHLAVFPETERRSARAGCVLIDLKRAPANERRAILKAGLDSVRSDVRALILLARSAREFGLDDLGSDCFTAALTALDGGDNGLRARLSIANEAMARDKPGTAADMLIGRLPLDRDTFELRLLAQALVYDYPIRQRAIRFFADLDAEVRSLFDFQTYEGILHVNHSEAWSRRAEVYIVKGIPIALAAGDWPGGGIAFADFLTSIGEDLRVCYGTEAELSEAHTLIRLNRRSGGVLDAVTAWFAAGLGVLAILRERLGPLAIPRSEFARIQELAARFGGAPEIETMTLMYQDGQYVGRTITPEDHARRLEECQSRLAAIEETCAVESVVIPDGLPEAGDQLLRVPFGDAFIPAVIARQQRLLLSEDMMMRQVADRVFGTKGVWLQAVLLGALQAETMNWEDYCEAVVQLAAHRHGHVFVDAQVLLTVFERDASEELVKLEALCAYVGSANAEPVAQVELVAVVINAIWAADSFARPKVETATNVLLRALFLHVDRERRRDLAQALAERLSEAPKTYLTDWLGHGSTRPSGSAMEDGSDA